MTKKLETVQHKWFEDSDGALVRENTQYFSDEFFEELDILKKLYAARGKIGEFMHVARVPRAVHNKWVAEGFDPTTAEEDDYDALIERLEEIVKRLRHDGMDRFIMTDKTFR